MVLRTLFDTEWLSLNDPSKDEPALRVTYPFARCLVLMRAI